MYFAASVLDRMTGRSTAETPMPLGLATEILTDRELQVFELIGEGLTTRHCYSARPEHAHDRYTS